MMLNWLHPVGHSATAVHFSRHYQRSTSPWRKSSQHWLSPLLVNLYHVPFWPGNWRLPSRDHRYRRDAQGPHLCSRHCPGNCELDHRHDVLPQTEQGDEDDQLGTGHRKNGGDTIQLQQILNLGKCIRIFILVRSTKPDEIAWRQLLKIQLITITRVKKA